MRLALESAAPMKVISREQGVSNWRGKSSNMELNSP